MNATSRTMTMLMATMLLGAATTLSAQQDQPTRKPVVIEGKQTLPLRVLTRPNSSVYAEPSESAAIVKENLPAFQPLFVYTRPAISDFEEATWYEVGSDERGGVLGWMKSDDVMEWKQAMCLAYTHPEGRSPVMMFSKRNALAEIAGADAADRESEVNKLYETLESGAIPEDFPLLSVEPKRAVFMFIEDQFYLLPILQHEAIELDGREGRLMQLAAATTAKGGRGATTLQDAEFVKSATVETDASSDKLKAMKIDIVYVIDTSASMQPYIDGTRAAIKRVADKIGEDAEIAENVRFGLWAFRDSMDIPGIEYLTRNYTPELQTAAAFSETLTQVGEAKVGSRGFPEDVFSGMDKALTETAWNEGALRIIVLIGDAPSHRVGEKWNASGKGAEELRQFADESRVSVLAVHIKDPRAEDYFELTEEQFGKLAENRGASATAGASYLTVAAKDEKAFEALSDTVIATFKDTLELARKQGDVSTIMEREAVTDFDSGDDAAEKTPEVVQAETAEVASQMIKAALVDWIGKEEGVQPPRDIVAWVVDKDLKDPAIPALEVRVLINKNELDSMRTVLQEMMVAGRTGQQEGKDFFSALQATSAILSVTPEQIKNARTLTETGLIPEFLTDLPYKSRIMSMSADDWNNWSQDQQDEFLNDLDAKISYYGTLHDQPDLWIAVNQGDDPDAHVHPISLEMLP